MQNKTASRQPGALVMIDPVSNEPLIFEGFLFGAKIFGQEILSKRGHKGYGEVVFNTSMTGYQEILTDPSYYGQIICMTVPHIGNTGMNSIDPESNQIFCSGFIIHELSEVVSNHRSERDLEHDLIKAGIPGLLGVDTRALTRRLRSFGVLRGLILPLEQIDQAKNILAQMPAFEGRDMLSEVTTKSVYQWTKPQKTRFKVIAVDYGVKAGLLNGLMERECQVEVVPAQMSAKEILDKKPNGVFLSNGPGDPSAAPYAAKIVGDLIGRVPIFGVCMGHQILSIALGAKTYKLKFGHRGGNQPVQDQMTGCVEISSHNHGYAVDPDTLPPGVEVTHLNLNDKTVEGIRVLGAKAMSVQYHPEACPGPHDSTLLFDRFIDLMNNTA